MKLNALLILATCLSVTASATEPAAGSAPTAPETPAAVAAPATDPAAAAATTDLAAARMTDQERSSLQKWARTNGYKPTQKAHGTWWCKSEARIGERIPRTTCASEESLADMQKAQDAAKESLAEKMRICGGTGCINK